MKNNIRITVGIPTYNGAKCIVQAIESVLSQVDEINANQLEILISDNASTDHTGEIVKSLIADGHPLITYWVNSKNIGYDRNVDNLFKRAKGEYVWLLGDDDYLEDGALTKAFSTLEDHEDLAAILMTTRYLNIHTGEITNVKITDHDILSVDKDHFFQITKWSSAPVSSLILNREDWNAERVEEFFGSQWIHIGALIMILSKDKKAFVIAREMITVCTGNNRWEGHFGNQLKVGLIYLVILRRMLEFGYKEETYKYYEQYRYKTNIRDIVILRPHSFSKRWEIARMMTCFFKSHPSFWIVHIPLLIMPSILFLPLKKTAIYLHKKLRHVCIWGKSLKKSVFKQPYQAG